MNFSDIKSSNKEKNVIVSTSKNNTNDGLFHTLYSLLRKHKISDKGIISSFKEFQENNLEVKYGIIDPSLSRIYQIVFFYYVNNLKMNKSMISSEYKIKGSILQRTLDEIKLNTNQSYNFKKEVNIKYVCNLYSVKNNINDYRRCNNESKHTKPFQNKIGRSSFDRSKDYCLNSSTLSTKNIRNNTKEEIFIQTYNTTPITPLSYSRDKKEDIPPNKKPRGRPKKEIKEIRSEKSNQKDLQSKENDFLPKKVYASESLKKNRGRPKKYSNSFEIKNKDTNSLLEEGKIYNLNSNFIRKKGFRKTKSIRYIPKKKNLRYKPDNIIDKKTNIIMFDDNNLENHAIFSKKGRGRPKKKNNILEAEKVFFNTEILNNKNIVVYQKFIDSNEPTVLNKKARGRPKKEKSFLILNNGLVQLETRNNIFSNKINTSHDYSVSQISQKRGRGRPKKENGSLFLNLISNERVLKDKNELSKGKKSADLDKLRSSIKPGRGRPKKDKSGGNINTFSYKNESKTEKNQTSSKKSAELGIFNILKNNKMDRPENTESSTNLIIYYKKSEADLAQDFEFVNKTRDLSKSNRLKTKSRGRPRKIVD